MTRRTVFAGAAFLSLALAACSQGGGETDTGGGDGDAAGGGEMPTLNIQAYPGAVANMVHWVAADAGICEKHGITCVIQEIASGPLGLQALIAGEIQVSFASTDVTMQARAKGTPVKIVVASEPNNLYSFVVAPDTDFGGYPEGMQSVTDAAIGVTARGAATEIQTYALFQGAGLDPNSATYVPVGSPSTGYPALTGGTVEAAMVFEPFQTLCVVNETCEIAVELREGEGPEILQRLNGAFETYAMTEDFIEENPEAVDGFIAAIEEAVEFIQDEANYEEVLSIVQDHFTLGDVPNSEGVVEQIVQEQIPRYGASIDREAVTGFSDFLMEFGIITEPVDPNEFVYENAPEPAG